MGSSSFFVTIGAAAIGLFMLFRNLRFRQEDNKEENSSSSSSSSSPQSPTSPSSSLNRIGTHHVFPSFRGEDVRRDFLSHIQMEFQRNGITPFIDNEIKRGESIGLELIRAIRESKIAIILLSKNYASSSWCLDELAEIMKCREDLGQMVMVVFYKVDPSDVKKLTGDFGKVFRKTCSGKTKEVIARWRQALATVATIAGYHSINWDNEAAMIKKIATDISNKLNNSALSRDFDGLVGMRYHLKKMESLLCLDSDEVRMVGIWGPPGIGKTTIARFAYNNFSNSFQLSVFVESIEAKYTRPCSDDYSAKLHLQQQFMSQITNQNDMKISHLGVVQDRLKDKKVLVVLDGVDQSMQLDAMAKETWWFGPGSRIIITTQDRKLFREHGIDLIYEVDFPPTDEALQILCMYAFGQNSPKHGFEKLAQEVTKLAGELPLGLRVMGSYFRGMSKLEWEKALPRLRSSLDTNIQSILKFSYDALDDEDKDLFLHIACFFNYNHITKVEELLAETFLDVSHGLIVLAEKSLISIEYEYVKMHNLLAQLGRDIVRKQSPRAPGQRLFLVDAREICEVLNLDANGSASVIGIDFNFGKNKINENFHISERAFKGMSNLQFLRFNGDHDALHLPCGLDYLSRKLRLLHWEHFPMTYLPSIVNSKFLVVLDMRNSKLEKLWEGIKPLPNLKWMDLSSSRNLKELPDLSTATNLQQLNLSHCLSLVKLPSSIGNLINLKDLKLNYCSSLVELPSSIGNLINLKDFINLSHCSSLVELPSSIGNLINLKELNLRDCSSLVELPSSIGNLINLKDLKLNYCSSLVELPSSIVNATNLERLDLTYCSSLVELPSSIGNLINLKVLDLGHCSNLVNLPSSIVNATNLERLYLYECLSLVELPSSIGNLINLKDLNLYGCSSLVELPSSIGNLINLKEISLSHCSSLVELPSSIGDLINLKEISLSHCSSLVELPSSIGDLINLKEISLSHCSSMVELPSSIGDLINLKEISLSHCSSLVELPSSIGNLINLKVLDPGHCSNLVNLPSSIVNATNIERLYLHGCSSLVELPSSIGNLINLENLDLDECSSLVELPSSIGNLINLKDLKLNYCSSLVELPSSIGNLINIKDLKLNYCSSLVNLPSSIVNVTNLERLDLCGCSNLVELPSSIGNLINLKDIKLNYCSSLVELPSSIGNLINLKELNLRLCSNLVNLPSFIVNATNLERLYLYGCSSLVELPSSIGNLINLKELDLGNCSSLVELPSSIGNLINLKKLNLGHCSNLVNLPSSIVNATNLERLYLYGCSNLVELPSSIGNLINLKELNIRNCSSLVELPSSIGNLINLKVLYLYDCSSLVELPSSIGNLHKLHSLSLRGCSKLRFLPTNINLESLYALDLVDCLLLKSFPEISTNISVLKLTRTAIEEVPSSIKSWSHLTTLHMTYCENLKDFPHAFDTITKLHMSNTEIQEVPPCVNKFSRLKRLVLKGCRKLVSLPQIPDSLPVIDAKDCESLERLDCSFQNPNIRLNFVNCFKLNQEARDIIIRTPTSLFAVLPGREVPAHFTNRAATGGSLTIKLNEKPLPISMRFKACILLVNEGDCETYSLDVSCGKSAHHLYPLLTEHLYIFEVEEDVTSSELVFEFKVRLYRNNWKIKECGVFQLL